MRSITCDIPKAKGKIRTVDCAMSSQPLHNAVRSSLQHQSRSDKENLDSKLWQVEQRNDVADHVQLLSRNTTWMKHALRRTVVLRQRIVKLIVALRQEASAFASC